MFSLKAGSPNIALTPNPMGPTGGIINLNPTLTNLINVSIGGLNLFGASIAVTTPATDLYLTPPSGASVSLRGAGYVIPLKFYNAARTFYVGFQTTTLSGNTLWTLPPADGTANQALLTNGSGILSWGPTGGVGTVTSISQGSNIVLSPNPITTTGSVALSNTPSGLTSIGVGSLSISGSTIDNPTDLAQIKITNSIVLAPDSTDPVLIGGGGGSVTPLAFNNSGGTNYVALQAGALTGNTTWTLPLTDGSANQFLQTNGSGVLTFAFDNTAIFTDLTNHNQWPIATAPTAPTLGTAIYETALGVGALTALTTGYANTAIGALALTANTTGIINTAIGFAALTSNVSGENNTAVGGGTLPSNTSGYGNSGFGGDVLAYLTTGGFNTAVGYAAGSTYTHMVTGTENTLLGYGAGVNADPATNRVVIGYNAEGTADNTIQIGSVNMDFCHDVSALATNATIGFTRLPSCAGTPTGTPASINSTIPVVYDSTDNILYLYNSTWQPISGTGSVTSISQGANMNLSPNPITSTGTVALDTSLTGMVDIAVQTLNASGGNLIIGQNIFPGASNTITIYGTSLNIDYVCNIAQGAVTTGPTAILPTSLFWNTTLQGTLNINTASALNTAGPTNIGSTVCPTYLNYVTRFSNGTYYNQFEPSPSLAANVSWIWPLTDSTGTQFLQSDGSGNLSWGTGATGTVTSITQGTNMSFSTSPITTTGTINLASSVTGLTLLGTAQLNVDNEFYVLDNSALGASGGGALQFAGGYSSPTSGRLVFGDGSGWQFLLSKRISSTTTDIFTFQDNGKLTTPHNTLDNGSGNMIVAGTLNVTGLSTLGALTAAGAVNINIAGGGSTASNISGLTILSAAISNTAGSSTIYFGTSNIAIEPAGTGPVIIGNGSNINPLQFYNAAGTHYVALQAGAATSNTTWTLPLADSTGTQFLQSNGSGTLSWANAGTGSVTSITQGTNMSFSTTPITTTGTINLASNVLGLSSLTSSSLTYSTGTAGTASASNALVTGVGTAWTQAMVGGVIVFSNGVEGFIIEVNSSGLTLLISAAITVATGTSYVIYYGGTQHDASGFLNTKNILVENIAEYRNPKTGFYVKQPLAVTINKPAQAKMTGGTWISSNAFTSANLDSVCWAPQLGLFVAVGGFRAVSSNNVVLTSPDAINWTFQTAAATLQWISICWSPDLGLLCAINNNGTSANSIMTSPDSITWTSRSSPSSPLGLTSICWSSELQLFCAAGQETGGGAAFLTSPDGITWTGTGASGITIPAYGLTWSPELGIFVGLISGAVQASQVVTSHDGVNWTISGSSIRETWQSCCWSPELGLFVAVAAVNAATTCIMTSPNGTSWTTVTLGTAYALYSVCWSSQVGLFIAVSHNVTVILSSPDGVTWSTISVGGGSQTYHGICYSPELGIFCAVYDATTTLISPNATISTLGNTNIGGSLNVTNTASINTVGTAVTTIGNASSTTNIGGPLNLKGTINILNVSPLLFYDTAGTNYVGFEAASSLSGNTTWRLPTTDGGAGEALVTNGSGVLSWSSTGVGSVTSITQGTNMSFSVTPITTTGTINLASTVSGLTSLGTAALTVTGLSTLGALTQAGTANINATGSAATNLGNNTGLLTQLGSTVSINQGTAGITNINTSGTGGVNIGNASSNSSLIINNTAQALNFGRGTVTQTTSQTTPVTLNGLAGKITTFPFSGSFTNVSFTFNNSCISSTSNVLLSITSIAGAISGLTSASIIGTSITSGSMVLNLIVSATMSAVSFTISFLVC